jgi:hypothetical protein
MLDENTKISLRHVVAVTLFFAGMVYGWQVIIGGIQTQQAILVANDARQDADIVELKGDLADMQKENSEKLDQLLIANGVKPEQ